MPLTTHVVLDEENKYEGAYIEYIPKPNSKEEAKLVIAQTLQHLLQASEFLQRGIGSLIDTKIENIKTNLQLVRMAGLAGQIEVGTAVAVRLPNTSKIETFYNPIWCLPMAIVDMSNGRNNLTIPELTDEIMKTMEQSGTPVTKIAGGIDFANEKIKKLLDIDEGYFGAPEKGIYRGLPQEGFLHFLQDKARQMTT
jgi:hypothetical protein